MTGLVVGLAVRMMKERVEGRWWLRSLPQRRHCQSGGCEGWWKWKAGAGVAAADLGRGKGDLGHLNLMMMRMMTMMRLVDWNAVGDPLLHQSWEMTVVVG